MELIKLLLQFMLVGSKNIVNYFEFSYVYYRIEDFYMYLGIKL